MLVYCPIGLTSMKTALFLGTIVLLLVTVLIIPAQQPARPAEHIAPDPLFLAVDVAPPVTSRTAIYNFQGSPGDGAYPSAGLVISSETAVYGTTQAGGTAGLGTVFELKPPAVKGGAWTETVLHNFTGGSDGIYPYASLAIGGGGVLYGTTAAGGNGVIPCYMGVSGCGTVFSLAPPVSGQGAWTETVLYNFTDGSDGGNPVAGVVIGRGAVLYGTTRNGGSGACGQGCGTVFSLAPPVSPGGLWTEKALHEFGAPGDGAQPAASLTIGDGVLYGTTYYGGSSGVGTVFSLAPPAGPGGAWTETILHNFTGGGSDGINPSVGVTIGSGGVLYGATFSGGGTVCGYGSGCGTVFSLAPPSSPDGAWEETVLHFFMGSDGALPEGSLAIGSNGVLYGTTSAGGTADECFAGCGTVFQLTPPLHLGGSWTETVLHSFTNSDGSSPVAGVAVGQSGALYGTAQTGGTTGLGTAFALKP